jgi:mycothiol synthase
MPFACRYARVYTPVVEMSKTLTLKFESALEAHYDRLVEIQKRSAEKLGDPISFERSDLVAMRAWPRIGASGLQVIRDEGEIVGFLRYLGFLDAVPPCILAMITVDPQHRSEGIADWAYPQILTRAQKDGAHVLDTMADSRDRDARAFLERRGFEHIVSLWTMEADTDFAPQEAPPVPRGFRLRTYRSGEDASLLTELINHTFNRHVTFVSTSADEMRSIESTPGFDPALTLILETEAGEAVAYARNTVRREARDGWIDLLGVRPEYQGRGLGRFMLLESMFVLAQLRPRIIRLSLEGTNDRARALYDSEGFMQIRTRVRYRRDLTA